MSLRNIRLLATYCSKSNIALGSMGVAAGPLNPHRTCMNELCGSWRHYMHVSGLSFFLFADSRRFGPIQSESGHIGRNRSNQVETGFELGWNSSKKINNNTKLNVLNFEATLNQKKNPYPSQTTELSAFLVLSLFVFPFSLPNLWPRTQNLYFASLPKLTLHLSASSSLIQVPSSLRYFVFMLTLHYTLTCSIAHSISVSQYVCII